MSEDNIRVAKAAGFIMVTMMLSRVIGYIRDIIIYSSFGQNRMTDAYNAAFSIPDFLYILLVGGALSSAFIPVFSGYIVRNEEEEAWEVASTIFNIIIIFLAIGTVFGIIFAPQLVKLIVPGFDAKTTALTVKMTRIMFIQVVFMSLSGISMGILNSFKHFAAPAIGSILYNVGIIIVGSLLAEKFGIFSFSVGVVVGSFLTFIVQVPVLIKKGIKYKPVINLKNPGVRKIFFLIVPILIGQSAVNLNLFITQNLASGLPAGMIAALKLGDRMTKLPIAMIGISLASAVFPTMTSYIAKGKIDLYKDSFLKSMRNVIFFSLPASVGMIVLGKPIIRFMYQQGAFTAQATKAAAISMGFYAVGITAYSAIHVLSRAFYSLHDTKTPVFVSVISMVVNFLFSILLIKPMGQGGLALAYSIAGVFNMMAMVYLLRRKVGNIGGGKMLDLTIKTCIASATMGLLVLASTVGLESMLGVSSKLSQGIITVVGFLVGVVSFLGAASFMKMEEVYTFKKMFLGRIFK